MRRRFPKYFPGWFVSGGGGSGGAATVQTDGVTIQGDGSAGNKIAIKAVQVLASLSGAGTVASPLGIHASPFYGNPISSQGVRGITANQVNAWGVVIPYPVTFSKIAFVITTQDLANNSDIGLYNAAGTLLANVGAQHFPAAGFANLATVQGSITIQGPALFWLAFTSAASTLIIRQQAAVNQGPYCYATGTTGDASVGGALPATITPLAAAIADSGALFALN